MPRISRITLTLLTVVALLGLCACGSDAHEPEGQTEPGGEQAQEPHNEAQAESNSQMETPKTPRTGGPDAMVSRVLSQSFNLAPRCSRGENQKMLAEVSMHYLGSEGMIRSVKRNEIQYDQLCLHNSRDSLVYQIQIDSLKLGAKLPPKSKMGRHSVPNDFVGYSFEQEFHHEMRSRDGCYAHEVALDDSMRYTEAFEFLSMFIRIELMEQLRYTAAGRLSRIGDSLTVALPGPICYDVPEVVREFRQEQQPFHMTFSGITRFGSHACAIIDIESDPSPLSIEFAATQGTWTGSGSAWFSGEFLVSLNDGNIVSATLRERMEATQKYPDDSTAPNPVLTVTKLTQLN